MYIRSFLTLLMAAGLSACGGSDPQPTSQSTNPPASEGTETATPAAAPGGAPTSDSGSGLKGIVLRYAPGGRPDAFCIPQWSIANQTAADIPGLLIQITWHGPDGQVLQDIGEFGTLQEDLSAGRQVDRTLGGHAVACDQLKIAVASYACRDENAVRMTCPGPVHVLAEGGIQVDVSALAEGPMRGAVEG